MTSSSWVVSQTRVCDTGPQSLPPACAGVGHKGMVKSALTGRRISSMKHSCRSGVNWVLPVHLLLPASLLV